MTSKGLADLFYPRGWWAGYARFFEPALRGRDGSRLVCLVHSAMRGESPWEPVLRMLTTVHHKSPPGAPTARCEPTREADEAVAAILMEAFGVGEEIDE